MHAYCDPIPQAEMASGEPLMEILLLYVTASHNVVIYMQKGYTCCCAVTLLALPAPDSLIWISLASSAFSSAVSSDDAFPNLIVIINIIANPARPTAVQNPMRYCCRALVSPSRELTVVATASSPMPSQN